MTRRHATTAATIALLAGAVFPYRWWISPERQIQAILADVAAALSHDEPNAGFEALAAVAALQQHLAIDALVETAQVRIAGRHEIVALAARVRAATPMLRVRFFDPRMTFAEGSALLAVTAEVTTRHDSGQDLVDVHQLTATLEEMNDKWVVRSARLAPVGEPAS